MLSPHTVPTLTRFAPSPTGYLHLGHAASAWFAYEQGTNFILRIEDIDTTRCKPEFCDAILDDLTWLGLTWPTPVRKQSQHLDDYKKTLQILTDRGLTYPCFCTRKDIDDEIKRSPSAPHGPDGYLYPGTCKNISESNQLDNIAQGKNYAIRLHMAKAIQQTGPLRWLDHQKGWQDATPHILGDVVLARKDTPASYHLCVTHDDALQNINLVTRGDDLFHATHLHRLLQELLNYPVPNYHHHPLLTDADGKRFAKRDKSLTIREIRNKGFSAAQLRDIIDHRNFAPLTR
jgi:glutamyl-Q tRNA(Asp) synthetase